MIETNIPGIVVCVPDNDLSQQVKAIGFGI
jgi:hypothetical protein